MKYVLSLFLLLSVLVSCHSNKVDPLVPTCTDNQVTRTNQFIKDIPATILAVKLPSQQTSYQIQWVGTSTILGSCNLPVAFTKDSLKITVSGYFLTFPGLKFMNLNPLPFEVTEAKLRE